MAKTLQIHSNNPLLANTVSMDLEWEPFSGIYEHPKTQLVSGAFCDSSGERLVYHIDMYDSKNPERELVNDIVKQIVNVNVSSLLTWGGSIVPRRKDNDSGDINGIYGDLFILHQRCFYHGLESPFELTYGYKPDFKDPNRHHIDLHFLFNQTYIKNGLFGNKYRSTSLDDVSSTILDFGKYNYIKNGEIIEVSGKNVNTQSLKHQILYVARDAELVMLLASYQDSLLFRVLNYVAQYSGLDFSKCTKSYVSQIYQNIYDEMIEAGDCVINRLLDQGEPQIFDGKDTHSLWSKPDPHEVAGGLSLEPARRFYDEPVDILDVKSLYPSIAIKYNLSFETVNCYCCQDNPLAEVPHEIIDEINEGLTNKNKEILSERLWVCKHNPGAYPKKVGELLEKRKLIQSRLKEEKSKLNPDQHLIVDLEAQQISYLVLNITILGLPT